METYLIQKNDPNQKKAPKLKIEKSSHLFKKIGRDKLFSKKSSELKGGFSDKMTEYSSKKFSKESQGSTRFFSSIGLTLITPLKHSRRDEYFVNTSANKPIEDDIMEAEDEVALSVEGDEDKKDIKPHETFYRNCDTDLADVFLVKTDDFVEYGEFSNTSASEFESDHSESSDDFCSRLCFYSERKQGQNDGVGFDNESFATFEIFLFYQCKTSNQHKQNLTTFNLL